MFKMKVRKEKKGSEELSQGYGGGEGGAGGLARGKCENVISGYNRAICSKLIPKIQIWTNIAIASLLFEHLTCTNKNMISHSTNVNP